ncbi:MAG: glycosyl hydrolase 53 family protein [Paludibacteraceae bacterium]|nr:glycosyl hydrolase 53 family protein [Paludibacteraceae bacterium]
MKYRLFLLTFIVFSLSSCYYRSATPRDSFAKGADVSWLSEMEHDSIAFYDTNGTEDDCLDIMQRMGMNAVRLRVWVNHSTGWSNKSDVVQMAQRAAKKGLRIMIDFHYSDFFADPNHQTIPVAWQSYDYELLREAVFEHTLDVLNTLKEARVKPEWVQIGNETPNGMLWPVGQVSKNADDAHWSAYAGFTQAGYKAAKEVFSDIKVIVHVDNAFEYRDWFFDALLAHGAQFDMIGLSHYPMMYEWSHLPWQEMNTRAEANIRQLISTYRKPVVIAEIGMQNWGQGAMYDSVSACANEVMVDFINRVTPIDSCVGIFYWEPQCYNEWKPAEYVPLGWGAYNMGSFTPEGKPSPALVSLFATKKE